MGKVIWGPFQGFVIGIGCRCFDIPLSGPPKLIGELVALSMTLGHVGMDYLLSRHAK